MGTIIEATATAEGGSWGALGLADAAARLCLERAKRTAEEVDLLIDAGVYNDKGISEPAVASLIQEDIGANLEQQPGAGQGTFSFDVRNGGTVNLRSCGRSANRISLIRHTRPGESRRRTGENRPRTAQVDSAGVGHGKKAAHFIDAWLRDSQGELPEKHPIATFDKLHLWYFGDAARRMQPELPPDEAVAGFEEVVGGLTAQAAAYEAGRCLSCGNCFECDGCFGSCPEDAINKVPMGHQGYEFNYDKCTGCGTCFDQCPVHAIEMIPEPR